MKIIKRTLPALILCLVLIFLVSFSVKGKPGSPLYFQTERDEQVGGPFESTFSTSRYALVEAIVENHTFFFTDEQAKFSAPDITYYQGKYFSIFTPGVSFLAIPLYMLGRIFGLPQFFTFLLNPLVGLVNVLLIVALSRKFSANKWAGLVGGVLYLFATNASVYSSTLAQHQLSALVILLGLLNALKKERSLLANISFGVIFGLGTLVDIPNAIALLPSLFAIFIHHFSIKQVNEKYSVSIKTSFIGLLMGVIPLVGLFMWYNARLTQSPFELGQTIGRSDYPHVEQPKEDVIVFDSELARKFTIFDSRRQLNNSYLLLVSDERGILYFYPIVILGILGLVLLYKNTDEKYSAALSIATISMTFLLYSMHADPWGGWAFGSRYFLPINAVLCAGIAYAIERYGKKRWHALLFTISTVYSVAINTAGLLTTNAIPPKVEAVNLSSHIPWTYAYNFQFLEKNESGVLLYNLFLSRYMTVYQLYFGLVISVCFTVLVLYVCAVKKSGREG